MRFLRPEAALWLFALIATSVCWSLHYWPKWLGRDGSGTLLAAEARRFSRRTGRTRDAAVLLLTTVAIGTLVVALMRPQIAREVRTPIFERRDLVILLDRSLSMRARDVRPSRFARAVDEIQRFLRAKPETIDRVALIGFAGASVVLSYPTDDVDSLAFYLDWSAEDYTPHFGTNIAAALSTALDMTRREKTAVPPLFVVISDGEDQSGRLNAAANPVVRAGIHIHAIGIGSDTPVAMPVPTGDGREEFLRDDYGQLVTTLFSGATLEQLAAISGGRYFRSRQGGELLQALERLSHEERRQTGWRTTRADRDVYRGFLAAAALATLGLVVLL